MPTATIFAILYNMIWFQSPHELKFIHAVPQNVHIIFYQCKTWTERKMSCTIYKREALVARHAGQDHQLYIVKSFYFLTCSSSLFQFSSEYLYNTPSLLDLFMLSKALNSRLLFPECCPISLVPTRSTRTGNEICLRGSDGNCKEHRYFKKV